MTNEEGFVQWLMTVRGIGTRPARDVLYRCRRIERVFRVRLDDIVVSEEIYEEIQEKLQKESGRYLKQGTNEKSGVANHRSAVKRYLEYRASIESNVKVRTDE